MHEKCGPLIYILYQVFGYLFQTLPLAFLVFLPFPKEDFRFGKKRTIATVIGICILLSVAASIRLSWIYRPDMTRFSENTEYLIGVGNLWFTGILAVCTLLYWLGLRGGVRGRMLSYIFGCQYSIAIYIVAEILTKDPGAGIERLIGPYDLPTDIVYGVAALVVCPLLCLLIQKYGILGYQIREVHTMRRIIIGMLAMLIVYTIALLVGLRIYRRSMDHEISVLSVVWLSCMLVAALFVYATFLLVVRTEDQKGKLQAQLATFDIQYQAMEDKIRQEKQFHHDMRHHFRALATQLDAQDLEGAKLYLASYLEEWEQTEKTKPTDNPVFNSILEHYIAQAQKKEIRFELDILMKEQWSFNLMDMTVLLGNILENAMEACLRSEEKKPVIRFRVRQKLQMLLIQVENTCDDRPLVHDEISGVPYSTKREGRHIGYGIGSVQRITEKYAGTMEYWKENDRFTMRILLNIPQDFAKSQE